MFRVETFIPVLNSLIPHLTKHAEAHSSIDSVEPNKQCEKLTSVYRIDFDYGDILNECKHLKDYIILDEKYDTFPTLYRKIIAGNLKSMFSNVEITIRVFLCMMMTNCVYRGTIIFKIKTHKESPSQHNGAATFELAYSHG